MTPEQTITEHGPRVLARYGRDYFNGWCAGLRTSAEEKALTISQEDD